MLRKAKTTHDVSVRGEIYTPLRDYCKDRGVAIGHEVSIWVDEHFDRLEAQPIIEEPEAKATESMMTSDEIDAETRKHFTF